MIILCRVNSGMCNRLIPYITSIRLANKLNAEIYILWDDNCADMDYKYIGEKTTYNKMFENIENVNFIDINKYKALTNTSSNRLIINYMMEKSISQYSLEELKKYNILIFNCYVFPIFTKDCNILFNRYSDSGWLNTINKEYFECFKLLKPKKYIQDKINCVLNKFTIYNNMVGIHIRHWPNKWLKQNNYLLNNNDNIRIEYIKNMIDINENIKFFISSSDYKSIKNLIHIFGNKIIYFEDRFGETYDDKYYTSDDKKSTSNINKNLNGVVDLFLLSKCNTIFGDISSSFSVCACLLNSNCKFINTITKKI